LDVFDRDVAAPDVALFCWVIGGDRDDKEGAKRAGCVGGGRARGKRDSEEEERKVAIAGGKGLVICAKAWSAGVEVLVRP
jgi:hypothetical protein